MKTCPNCGEEYDESLDKCPKCSAALSGDSAEKVNTESEKPEGEKKEEKKEEDEKNVWDKITDTEDSTSGYDPKDIEDNKVVALLSYIYILFLVPLLAAKDSPFAKFHANQGLVLFIVEFIAGTIFGLLIMIPAVGWIFGIILGVFEALGLVFMIIGILNAYNGKARILPLIGKITLIK